MAKMTNTKPGPESELALRKKRGDFGPYIKRYWQLYALLALPLLYRGVSLKERRRMAQEALEMVGLAERTEFLPNQLSGGQCQRVAIARAIVGKPKLLLADEPTGALDTAAGQQIMEIFRKLSDSGITIIMITHEPHIAECADKIYRILDGRLITGKAGQEPASDPLDRVDVLLAEEPGREVEGDE